MLKRLLFFLSIIFLILLVIIPLYWVIKTSFSLPEEAWDLLPPKKPVLHNYFNVLSFERPKTMAEVVGIYATITPSALIPLINSLTVAFITVILTLIISSFAAYNLARFSYKGKKFVSYYVLFAYIFPPFILMVPIMFLANVLGVLNNLFALSLIHLTYSVPFSTYMLRGYFLSIPRELDEQAFIDGCSNLQVLLKIILPLALPGLVTVAIFSFVYSWCDMIFSLVIIQTQDKFTLPLYISGFLWGGEITDPCSLSAITVIAGLIPVILFLMIQKYVKIGLVTGAVKA